MTILLLNSPETARSVIFLGSGVILLPLLAVALVSVMIWARKRSAERRQSEQRLNEQKQRLHEILQTAQGKENSNDNGNA